MLVSGLVIRRGPHLPSVSGHVVTKQVGLPIVGLDEEAEMVRIIPGSYDPSNLEFTTSEGERNGPFISLVS